MLVVSIRRVKCCASDADRKEPDPRSHGQASERTLREHGAGKAAKKSGMLLVHTFERSRSQWDVHGHQISTARIVVDTAVVPVRTLDKELDDVHIGKSPVLLRQLLHCIVDLRLVETPIPKAKIVRATAANTSGVATVIDH
jgi:hypothetical protein